jgi:hypothetical protein
MHAVFFSGPTSVLAAALVAGVWHFRRSHRKWDFRKSDYAWVFLQGGVAYVMTVFLIEHFWFGTEYSKILERNFGGPQINVAFIGALWESLKSVWDLWWGDGHLPRAPGDGAP